MNEYTFVGYIEKNSLGRMSDRQKLRVVQFLWFVIAATFVIHVALLWDIDKSFY